MAIIQDLLQKILSSRYGKDVRQSIHDSIEQCYKDATGHPDSVAALVKEVDGFIHSFKNASGTEIVATDSSSGYATDFSCEAKTEQKQYSGKNLLNNTATSKTINGVTFTVNKDRSVTVSGTATAQASLILGAYSVTEGETYIMSGRPVTDASCEIQTSIKGTTYRDVGNGVTFTATATTTSIPVAIIVRSGATINATFYPMIRKASVSDATYEPYTGGASPNPSYPQAILNSGDCVELEIGAINATTGADVVNPNRIRTKPIPCKSGDVINVVTEETWSLRNLYLYNDSGYVRYIPMTQPVIPANVTYFRVGLGDITNVTPDTAGKVELTINGKYVLQVKSETLNMCSLVDRASTTSNGVTYSCNNQLVSASGTSTGNADIGVGFAENITFEAGKSYTISLQGNFAHSANLNVYFYNIATNAYGTPFGIDSTNVKTFSFNEAITARSILLRGFSGNTMSGSFKVQVQEGDTATDYVEHKEHISTILLDEPIRAVNDVKDVIEYVNDGYKVRRKVGSVVFNGSENWWYTSNLGTFTVTPSNIKSNSSNVLCSHYVDVGSSLSSADDYGFHMFSALHFRNKDIASLDDWKALLAENPITVQYEMAEEVIEDIADQTPFYNIPTYDGGTTISTTDRLQPQFEVEYPTNRVAGVASKGYVKASAMSDKILSYQFRDVEGEDYFGATMTVNLPGGVDARNCTILVSYAFTTAKYAEMVAGTEWKFGITSDVETSCYTGDDGASAISVYIKLAESGVYAHANVTVIRNDI